MGQHQPRLTLPTLSAYVQIVLQELYDALAVLCNQRQFIFFDGDRAEVPTFLDCPEHFAQTDKCHVCLVKVEVLDRQISLEQVADLFDHIVIDGAIFGQIQGMESNASRWVADLPEEVLQIGLP